MVLIMIDAILDVFGVYRGKTTIFLYLEKEPSDQTAYNNGIARACVRASARLCARIFFFFLYPADNYVVFEKVDAN